LLHNRRQPADGVCWGHLPSQLSRVTMDWLLDHVLLAAHYLPQSVAFYECLLEAEATQFEIAPSPDSAVATTAFAHLLGAEGTSLHLARPTPNFHALYPEFELNASGPHFAVTVKDIAGPTARLEANGWLMMGPRAVGPTG
jgi:4-hydroxyphenylpyruvate dioxygenase-like putative hemolysin